MTWVVIINRWRTVMTGVARLIVRVGDVYGVVTGISTVVVS